MKKILFVCDHSMNLVGGSQESLKVVLDGLKRELCFSLITPGVGKYSDKYVKHYHFSKYDSMKTMIKHPFSFIKYYFKMLKIIKKEKYAIIHTQEQVGYFCVALFKRFHLIPRNTVLIHTERGLLEKYSRLFRVVFFQSLKYTDAFLTTTKYNHSAWNKVINNELHNKHVKCLLVENTAGARFEIYQLQKRVQNSNYITIGFAGRYCSWKGWERVVEICNGLRNNKKIHVEIALGCLTEHDMRKGKELEARIAAILGDRFKCHFNYDIEQMDEFYYGIDVFIITSDPNSESFGRVLVEAMSRHVAVLGTDCGGATEVIGDKNRICYSINEFIEKITEYSLDRKRLLDEQEKCYERYINNYSVNNNVVKHRKIYKHFLEKNNI